MDFSQEDSTRQKDQSPKQEDEGFKKSMKVPANINREHLAQKCFTSKTWLIYCLCQILLTLILICYVLTDIKNK